MTHRTAPKLELHLHLEGAAPPALVRSLAKEKNIDISGIFDADGAYAYRDFPHFLQVYEAACTALEGPEDFHRLTCAVLEECAKHGVIYVETFLSPDFCGNCDLAAWRDYLAAIEDAAAQMQRSMGITMKGIITCVRHFGPDQAKKAARCAAETAGDFIVGYGMAGAETVNRPKDYAYSFEMAAEAGLQLTCHAGEWGGAQMVRDTMRDLNVVRLGHGFQAIEDNDVLTEVIDRGITLELCPGSNVALNAVASWEAHPIEKLRRAGAKVTVSTDDPPFFRTTMTKEYEALSRVFAWGEAEFAQAQATALAAAFCDDVTRTTLAKTLAATHETTA